MSKEAISVTLHVDNLTWLRARVVASGARSISDLLDQLVTSARRQGGRPKRSVVGDVEISASDPDLLHADEAIRSLFKESLARPVAVHESSPSYSARSRTMNKKSRG